jgi:hypothetical protein
VVGYIAQMRYFALPPFIVGSVLAEEAKKKKVLTGLRFSGAICMLAIKSGFAGGVNMRKNYLLNHE